MTRNVNADFNRLVAVEAASKDTFLRYFYWDLIFGDSKALPQAHELIEDEVCHVYNLSSAEYRSALVNCLANVVLGVKTGRELIANA